MSTGRASRRRFTLPRSLVFAVAALLVFAAALPAFAQAPAPASGNSQDFGQYVVDHQDTLAPFFSKNAGDFFRLAIPVLLGVAGLVISITIVVGWGLDVLMSRGFAFFYAPAFADWKRAIIYATGSLILSFIYTGMAGLVLVLLVDFSQAGTIIPLALLVLGIVAIAAQIVWILYLFRTSFGRTILFYLAVVVVHSIAAYLIILPILASRPSPDVTNFVDKVMTPRLQAEAQATRQELATVAGGHDSAQAKVAATQDAIAQAQTAQDELAKEIEQKKNSDLYAFAQIVKARAHGELESARDGFAAFPSKFPGSPLEEQVRAQLAAVNDQIAAATAQHKQDEADAAHTAAVARADLLARAAKGQATLSEMRQALIGRSRKEVSALLGPPSDTGPDQWNYRQQMILNPLTSEQTGLTVYFNEGLVQSLDYNRGGN